MHNRQSGAAHVPIMFFLILLVMFLGALGFAYVTQTDNGDLMKARDEARAELAILKGREILIEHYIKDIGDVIGKPGTYEGREGQASIYKGATLTYPGVMNPKDVKQVLESAAGAAQVPMATSLENLFGSMVSKINSQKQRVQDIELERDKALADKNQTDGKFNATASEAAATARTNKQDFEQARADFESAKTDKNRQIAQLQETVKRKADELTTAKEEALAREKDLKGQIALLKTQNSALVEKAALVKPPEVADGKILVAENGLATAFINLGRKDMLQPGTVFRVQSTTSNAVKGYCQVTRVEDERAEVRLYDFADPIGDWARQGDLLFNDLYTPRVSRTIFLMGRFSAPYDQEKLANLLRRLGNRVVTKMAPGVDTVIVGNNPINEAGDGFAAVQDSEDFKLANELRVEFTYLPKIADLIRL